MILSNESSVKLHATASGQAHCTAEVIEHPNSPRPRHDDIRQFVDACFDYIEGGWVYVRGIAHDKGRRPQEAWFSNDSRLANNLFKFALKCESQQLNVYVSIATVPQKGMKTLEVDQTAAVVADFDDFPMERLEYARTLLGEPTLIVETGGLHGGQRRLQVYWGLSETATVAELQIVERARCLLAEKSGGDPTMGRVSQAVRLPGSVHQKGIARQCRVQSYAERDFELTDILDSLEGANPIKIEEFGLDKGFELLEGRQMPAGRKISSDILDDPDLYVAANGAAGHTRFEYLNAKIGQLLNNVQDGQITLDEAQGELIAWFCKHIEQGDGFDQGRAVKDFFDMYRKRLTGSSQNRSAEIIRPTFVPSRLVDFVKTAGALADAEYGARELYCGEWLARQELCMFVGPTGRGKSLYLMALSGALSKGTSFCGERIPEPRNVLYVDAEMSGRTLQKRLQEFDYSPDRLRFIQAEDLANADMEFDLANKGSREQLSALFDDLVTSGWEPDLIILDNVASMVGGDFEENSNDDWRPVNSWLRERRAKGNTFIVVHHTGWQGEHGRGASNQGTNMQTILNIRLANGGEYFANPDLPNAPCFDLVTSKAREFVGPAPYRVWLTHDDMGKLAFQSDRFHGLSNDELDDQVLALVSEHGRLSATTVENHCKVNIEKSGRSRKDWRHAFKRLENEGYLVRNGKKLEISDQGKNRLMRLAPPTAE